MITYWSKNNIRDIDGNLSNTLFLAVGKGSSSAQLISSTTGAVGSWSLVSMNLFNDTTSVKSNGTMWLIGGSGSNSLAYSLTGTSGWTGLSKNTTTNPFTSVDKIIWNGISWVASGSGLNDFIINYTLAYSYSGTIWITISTNYYTSIGGLGVLYPNIYQFAVMNLYLENSRDTNLAPGTIQYAFNSGEVDNNYQYCTLSQLYYSLYKKDIPAYTDPLTITTLTQ